MNRGRILVTFYLATTLGCIVLNDTSLEWENDRSSISEAGPGVVDCSVNRIEHNLYECDSGGRVAIGLFPGMYDPPETSIGKPKDANFVNWSIVENIFTLCIPTIASMFYGPFPASEKSNSITRGGFFGAHRWREEATKELKKRDSNECVVIYRKKATRHLFRGDGVIGSDGIVLFAGYPGFEKVFAEVEKHGCVDVLHNSFTHIRRFSKSKLKLKEDALSYEDRVANESDDRIRKYKTFREDCNKLKSRVAKLEAKYRKYNRADRLGFVEKEICSLIETEIQSGAPLKNIVDRVNAVEASFEKIDSKATANRQEAQAQLRKGDWNSCRKKAEAAYKEAVAEDRSFWLEIIKRCDMMHGDIEVKKLHDFMGAELDKKVNDLGQVWAKVASWPETEIYVVREAISSEKARCKERIAKAQVHVIKNQLLSANDLQEEEKIFQRECKSRKWLYDYAQANTSVLDEIDRCRQECKKKLYLKFCNMPVDDFVKMSKQDILGRMHSFSVPADEINEIETLHALSTLSSKDSYTWSQWHDLLSLLTTNCCGIASLESTNANPIVAKLRAKAIERLVIIAPDYKIGSFEVVDDLLAMRSLLASADDYIDKDVLRNAKESVDNKILEFEDLAKQKQKEELIAKVRDSEKRIAFIREEIAMNSIRAKKDFTPFKVTLKGIIDDVYKNDDYKSEKDIEKEAFAKARDEAFSDLEKEYENMNLDARDAFNHLATDGFLGQALVMEAIRECISRKAAQLKKNAMASRGNKYAITILWNRQRVRVILTAEIAETTVFALNKGDQVYVSGTFAAIDEIGSLLRECNCIEKCNNERETTSEAKYETPLSDDVLGDEYSLRKLDGYWEVYKGDRATGFQAIDRNECLKYVKLLRGL